jgi:zinc protease
MLMNLMAAALVANLAHAESIPPADYKVPTFGVEFNPSFTSYSFPSGLRILFQSEQSQPIVAITAVIDRGSEHDQETYDGIAHVVEHLAFRANHGGVKNWDLIKQMGGSINASTSVDWTNYMTVAPRDALIPLLRIEALRLKDGVANVTQQDVTTEAEIARNELRMRYENAAVGAAWDELGNALFPADHPYARSTIGSHETLGNMSIEAVREFVGDNYRPEYTTMVVVGDFDLAEAGKFVLDWDVDAQAWTGAFAGSEELLMSQEDAEKFLPLPDKEKDAFVHKWFSETLIEHLKNEPPVEELARVDCSDQTRFDLPMPSQNLKDGIPRVQGMIDHKTVVVGWSLPGGYCEDQYVMNMTANLLTNYIRRELYPSWEYQKEDSALDGLGCFVSPDEYASQLLCFVEQGSGGGHSPEKIVEKVKDALYQQWQQYDPNMVNAFLLWNFNYARSVQMASMLQSIDLVSSLSGRATETAMFTHFTGNPAVFTTQWNWLNSVNQVSTREMAQKYVTRDRAVAVIVEPMNEEERTRREASARKESKTEQVQEYHATQDGDRYKSVYAEDEVTREFIESQVVKPDLENLRSFELENGLKVAILPYGEAPLVRVALQTKGDVRTADTVGLDSMADYSWLIGDKSRESLLAVAGFMGADNQSVSVSLPAGNLQEALNKMRWVVEDGNHLWRSKYERKNKSKSWTKSTKSDSTEPEVWANRYQRELLLPDHPLGKWTRPDEYSDLYKVSLDDLQNWHYTKWQPENSELFVVGRIDPDEAEKMVREYFGSWQYSGSGTPGEIGYLGFPESLPSRQVLVFDKPTATQTQVSLMCRLDTKDEKADAPRAKVVGSVLSEDLWRRLREEAGVTYGAYAYDIIWPGGIGAMGMQTLVQNDSVGFAIESMFDIVDNGAKGNVQEQSITTAKMSTAREYVLGQQSGEQMLNRLVSNGFENLDYFDKYPQLLSGASKSDFPDLLKTCNGKEVVTVIGPKQYATSQLDEKKISYQVIDWNELYKGLLTPKELKKFEKAESKKAESAE